MLMRNNLFNLFHSSDIESQEITHNNADKLKEWFSSLILGVQSHYVFFFKELENKKA